MGKKATSSLEIETGSFSEGFLATPKIENRKKHQKGDDVWGILEGSQLILKRLDI